MSQPGCELQERIDAGDREAIGRILAPLWPRLVRLADRLLWGKSRGDTDAEAAAQSAVRTYLRRADEGQFPNVAGSEDLFRLLATITCRKALKQIRRQRRAVETNSPGRVGGSDASSQNIEDLVAGTAEEQFDQICREWFELLPERSLRSVALMTLHGYTQEEIGEAHGFTTRNVRHKLSRIRKIWSAELGGSER